MDELAVLVGCKPNLRKSCLVSVSSQFDLRLLEKLKLYCILNLIFELNVKNTIVLERNKWEINEWSKLEIDTEYVMGMLWGDSLKKKKKDKTEDSSI